MAAQTLLPGAATSDIAFTPSVKAIQARKGSRGAYARMEQGGGWSQTIDAESGAFIGAQTSVFLATANTAGQPYIQHRGGPKGFLRVLDERTIAFADYRGNRQFITSGNLSENSHAFLFLIDYAQRRRIKIWGTARVVEDDAELIATLMPAGYKARPEQAIVFSVEAVDENCPQHIPQRFEAADVARALAERDAIIAERDARIATLEALLPSLRRSISSVDDAVDGLHETTVITRIAMLPEENSADEQFGFGIGDEAI